MGVDQNMEPYANNNGPEDRPGLNALRLTAGGVGVILMVIGAAMCLWLFWQVASGLESARTSAGVVNRIEALLTTSNPPTRPEPKTQPATDQVTEAEGTDTGNGATAALKMTEQQVRMVMHLAQDLHFHRILAVFLLLLVLGILVRLAIGLLSAGGKVVEMSLGSVFPNKNRNPSTE